MSSYYNAAQIVVSVALVIMVLLQVRGGGLGGIFGQPDTTFRVRRGLEKTMFQFTIVLVIIFITISILSVAKPW
jgi:preprotein translocase subunit SecG